MVAKNTTQQWLTTAAVLCGPSAACPLRLTMWTSWGRLVVPLLAQPDSAVKLFNEACTGWPIPTGNSSHGLRNNGPATARTAQCERTAMASLYRLSAPCSLYAKPLAVWRCWRCDVVTWWWTTQWISWWWPITQRLTLKNHHRYQPTTLTPYLIKNHALHQVINENVKNVWSISISGSVPNSNVFFLGSHPVLPPSFLEIQ